MYIPSEIGSLSNSVSTTIFQVPQVVRQMFLPPPPVDQLIVKVVRFLSKISFHGPAVGGLKASYRSKKFLCKIVWDETFCKRLQWCVNSIFALTSSNLILWLKLTQEKQNLSSHQKMQALDVCRWMASNAVYVGTGILLVRSKGVE